MIVRLDQMQLLSLTLSFTAAGRRFYIHLCQRD